MNYDDLIEAMFMDIYPLMPSSGTLPFTTLVLERAQLLDFPFGASVASTKQLLMAIRIDFSRSDLIDYLTHSREYDSTPKDQSGSFWTNYKPILEDQDKIREWCERIANMGIGMFIELFRRKKLRLIPIATDLSDLDCRLQLSAKDLQAYQLFDILPLD